MTGQLTDERGFPEASEVSAQTLVPTDAGPRWVEVARVWSKTEGRYDLALPPGTYRVGAIESYGGREGFWPRAATVTEAQDVVVSASTTRTDVDVRLFPALREPELVTAPSIIGRPVVGQQLRVRLPEFDQEMDSVGVVGWVVGDRLVVDDGTGTYLVRQRDVGLRISVVCSGQPRRWDRYSRTLVSSPRLGPVRSSRPMTG